jgi:hypothetical protein
LVQDLAADLPAAARADYPRRVATDHETATPTFELKRFVWGAPDRLEVSGTFGGLPETRADSAVLVVHAGESVHELPAVADSGDQLPEDGRAWQAEFAWQEAPVAFELAELRLGPDLVVQLPEPGAKKRLGRPRVLEVRSALAGEAEAPRAETPALAPPKPVISDGGAASVGTQVELITAHEEVREVRVTLQQTQEELTRARDDLQAERERRAGDGERFHEGLAKVREAAEEALAAEQSAAQQLGSDLREAHETIETQHADLEALRSQLELAANAEAEAESLREQVAKLERDGAEIKRLRAELDRTRGRAEAARAELEQTRGAAEQARNDAERLLGRLTNIRAK